MTVLSALLLTIPTSWFIPQILFVRILLLSAASEVIKIPIVPLDQISFLIISLKVALFSK